LKFTIKPNPESNPVEITYVSATLMTGLSPNSLDELIETIHKIPQEFGVMRFTFDRNILILRGGLEHTARKPENTFRMQVLYEKPKLYTQYLLQSPVDINDNPIMNIVVHNSFRTQVIERFLRHNTVSMEEAIKVVQYFLENHDIPENYLWQRELFTPLDWFQRHSTISYDTPAGYVADERPNTHKINQRIADIDGLNNRALYLETPQGRLSIFAIVELFQKDIHDPSFQVDRLHVHYLEYMNSDKETRFWFLINPDFYIDNLESDETVASFILENGQWDPANPSEAIEKERVQPLASYFFEHMRMPNNGIWVCLNHKIPVTAFTRLSFNQGEEHFFELRPSLERFKELINKLDGKNHHRVCIRANNKFILIHATDKPERLVFSYFERSSMGSIYRSRLVEKTKGLNTTPTRMYYSPNREAFVPFYETISKQKAIEVATNFIENGGNHFPTDLSAFCDWWSVEWTLP
jgi:hypothetical protein